MRPRHLHVFPLPRLRGRAGWGPLGRTRAWPRGGPGQGDRLVVGVEGAVMPAPGGVDRLARLRGLLHRRGVLDPGVVDADHHVRHRLLHQVEVAEGEVAVVELTIPGEALDHPVHMVAYAFGAAVLQGAGRRLDGVGDHDDRGLFGARPRAWVAEVVLADIEALLERLAVEVALHRRALMLLHDFTDRRREVVLLEQFDAFGDVRIEDVGARGRR